jgi:hypothetical protein
MHGKFQWLPLAGLLLAATAFASTPHKAQPLTKPAYEAQKAKIDAQYKADRKLCAGMKGHLQDVCEAEAKGRATALKAELEAQYRPSPDASQKAKNVTADANFEVAKTKCDVFRDQAKKRCLDEAKGAREAAIRQAKVEKVQETGGPFASGSAAAHRNLKREPS